MWSAVIAEVEPSSHSTTKFIAAVELQKVNTFVLKRTQQ